MYPQIHLLAGLIFIIAAKSFDLFPFSSILIVFLASILIDADHWIYYAFKKKDLSIENAYYWFISRDKKFKNMAKEKRKEHWAEHKSPVMIFHGIEFWAILLILSLYSEIFLFMLFGIALHIIFDYIDLCRKNIPFYTKFSQVYVLIKNKNKKEDII